jgi:hypothetical protein
LIISVDKTHLSVFSGNKKAWPAYMTIGNLAKDVRRSPNSGAQVLVGYLPVSDLDGLYSTDDKARIGRWALYHRSMRAIFEPLKDAGKTGTEMLCPDGYMRLIFPILAAVVADYEEQVLIASVKNNRCPKCLASLHELGECTVSPMRDPLKTAALFEHVANHPGGVPDAFVEQGLRHAYQPFWTDLPHCDIFQSFTPDLLHQLHKGVIKDYIIKWCQQLASEEEVDERIKLNPPHPLARHFAKGLSALSQWTGKESKDIERVLLGSLSGSVQPDAIKCVKSALDFVYLASYRSHTDTTLAQMDAALQTFHATKDIFVRAGLRSDFNIPKVHSMIHYTPSIRLFGSADGYNTETSERLHIDMTKDAYRASNRRDFLIQMTVYLQRREAVRKFAAWRTWMTAPPIQHRPRSEDNDAVNEEEEVIDIPAIRSLSNALSNASPAAPSGATSSPAPARRFLIAKAPSRPNQLLQNIMLEHASPHLTRDLEDYLCLRHRGMIGSVTPFHRINTFSRIRIPLPPAPALGFGASVKRIMDSVRAQPSQPVSGRRQARPPIFDTVLARCRDPNSATLGTPLEGVHGFFCNLIML